MPISHPKNREMGMGMMGLPPPQLWLKMWHSIDSFLQGSWPNITPEAPWILLHLIPGGYYNQ